MMKLEIEAVSDKGLLRDNNEDMISVSGILLRDDRMALPVEFDDDATFYLLLADGMGGHEHGERASQMLLEHLKNFFSVNDFKDEDFEKEICDSVLAFSYFLNIQAEKEGQAYPMGCTLTGVVWLKGKIYVLNAGDSRTYRFRNGTLRQLTTDETERGLSGNPDDSKYLVNCIGGGCNGIVTLIDITDRLRADDCLLICSDGLTDMASDEEIEYILSQNQHPAADLYELACRNGGADNLSVICAKVVKIEKDSKVC